MSFRRVIFQSSGTRDSFNGFTCMVFFEKIIAILRIRICQRPVPGIENPASLTYIENLKAATTNHKDYLASNPFIVVDNLRKPFIMIDTRHHPTNVIRQARRRSAPSHEMKAAHRADPAFWKAQMNIHQRVQKYEDEEEDSSDEYDDDFDLNIPVVETTKLNERNTPVAKRVVSPQKESNPPERKKSFSNVVHPRSVAYNTEDRNSNNLFVRRQLSSMQFPAQR